MASPSLGRLLLRPNSFARTPFYETCTMIRPAPSWTARRCISNTQEDALEPESAQSDASRPPHQRASNEETTQAIDSLFAAKASQRWQSPPSTHTRMSSGDQMQASRANHIFGSEFSDLSRARRSRAPPRLNFDDMTLPDSLLDPSLANKPSEAASLATQQEETFANYPRLNPTYGRSVELDVSRGRDLVRGLGMLGSLITRNRIRNDFNKQKFHERPGLRRKRLHSERWRARFNKGFKEVTSRVSELTGKGW